MPLTDVKIKASKPAEAEYKISDGQGLYLLVKKNGSKLWGMAYRFNGKQKKLSIGAYPAVGLAAARDSREDARKQLAAGKDPSLEKRLAKIAGVEASANTFEVIAKELVARERDDEGLVEGTIAKHEYFLGKLYPKIGARPVSEIQPVEIMDVLKGLEAEGILETARRVRAIASDVFRYAIRTARATVDPAAPLVGATPAPKVQHHAAIVDPTGLGGLMRSIEGYDGSLSVRTVLKVLPRTFVRSFEIRFADWTEFDLDGALWTIPPERMKMKRLHYVPLSTQTVVLMREYRAIRGGSGLVFPGIRSKRRPLSENTINSALRYMGYASDVMTGHGFRTSASTILNENEFNSDWIEKQLAHEEGNKVRGAYNAAQWLKQRRKMMQWWSNWLDLQAVDAEDLIG